MHGGLQFSESCLTGGQSFASGHIHRLDLLPGAGCSGRIHAATAAILIVLSIPDQLRPHLGERMMVIGAPADWIRHGDGPPGRASGPGRLGTIETAKMDFRVMFWNLRHRVNYYYPPDGSFESGKREKAFA
jgi:hypothetical protein